MAFTAHGHHIPGSTLIDEADRPDRTRCGGVKICPRCIEQSKGYRFFHGIDVPEEPAPTVPMNVPDDFPAKAKKILINYVDSHYSTAFEKPAFEVYVVWFVKVLQHWKALVSTDRSDGKYYELTYNGDKQETYVDEYVKVQATTVVPD